MYLCSPDTDINMAKVLNDKVRLYESNPLNAKFIYGLFYRMFREEYPFLR